MNLMKFKGADDAVKLTIRLSAGYCIILTIAFASSIIFLINKIEKAYQWVTKVFTWFMYSYCRISLADRLLAS